jgi:glyoxylase-like metal-dependent hydrolase (beta-lactamase superfamily II)
MREVAAGIFMITERGAFGALKPPVNIYVLPGPDGVIFDAGYGDPGSVRFFVREFRKLESLYAGGNEFRITRLVPSHVHPDHFSGLRALRASLGVPVALTAKMAAIVSSGERYRASYQRGDSIFGDVANSPLRQLIYRAAAPLVHHYYVKLFGINFLPDPDLIIAERGPLMINGEEWRIFPSPGHADDHISLYHEGRGVLFSGDNVLRGVTSWLGPPKSDLMGYITSLEEMLALPRLELILSAHGSPVTDPRGRIRELIAWRRQRIEDVWAALLLYGGKGATVRQLLRAIYPGGGGVKRMMAEGWVVLTLRHLVNAGRAESDQASPTRFFAKN